MLPLTTTPAPFDPQQPTLARSLPAPCYVEASFAALERRHVFAESWQLCGALTALPVDGASSTEIGGVPLLVLRDRDDVVRALHNVCRHRGGPLAACRRDHGVELVCRYHGWRYGLDGQLRGAPDMGRAVDFDVSAIRLPAAPVACWQGLVFVTLGAATPSFDDIVAGIDAQLRGPHALDGLRHQRSVRYEVECDWKLYVDNYLEGYHVEHVHPGLAQALDASNYRTELARWHSLQRSPTQPTQVAAAPSGAAPESLYDGAEALYYWLWPNTMLNILPGRLQTNRVLPRGAGRCTVEFDYYYSDATRAQAEADQRFSDEVQREDIAICEAVQRNLASGSYTPGRLNPQRESGLWHFHELLRATYRAAGLR